MIKVRVNSRENSYIQIGAKLPKDLKTRLTEQLLQNADLFAWVPADMPGIDPDFMSHQLAIEPITRPVAQRKRKLTEKERRIVQEKTNKLLTVGFIREIKYTTWLSNVVLVEKKTSGTWRMCVDFTDLNMACP